MAFELKDTGCCGMKELNNISQCPDAPSVLAELCTALTYMNDGEPLTKTRLAFFLFSGVTKRVINDHASNRPDNYALALADYIETEQLGSLVTPEGRINPRSGNTIQVWVWTPNFKAFNDWWEAHQPVKPEPVSIKEVFSPASLPGPLHDHNYCYSNYNYNASTATLTPISPTTSNTTRIGNIGRQQALEQMERMRQQLRYSSSYGETDERF
jgi:hypothetical protein